jgi:hypothetical protein
MLASFRIRTLTIYSKSKGEFYGTKQSDSKDKNELAFSKIILLYVFSRLLFGFRHPGESRGEDNVS